MNPLTYGLLWQAARTMWFNLIDLQPQTGDSGGGISRDDFISAVAKDIQVHFRMKYLGKIGRGGLSRRTKMVLGKSGNRERTPFFPQENHHF